MSFLGSLVANPGLVLQHRNLFLLSHMRANTSVFGHLLGSHPEIEGYYEMHMGYYSWKSLWRQKLRHFARHDAKPSAKYMFDKVLHDDHHIKLSILQRANSRTIMMLRAPEQSIKSLVVLYGQFGPQLPEATPEGAVAYYVKRLDTMVKTANQLDRRFFYLDAEGLITTTTPTLVALSNWLGLATPIPSEYQTFTNTGQGDAGDHSSRLKSGRIDVAKSDYSAVYIPQPLMNQAIEAYQASRTTLLASAERSAPV